MLETFPDELINIEIKATLPETRPYEDKPAALLAEFGRTDDTIVVSVLDHAVEAVSELALRMRQVADKASTRKDED